MSAILRTFTCISLLTTEPLFLQCLSSWSESTLLYTYTPVYRLYSTRCRRGQRFLTAAASGSTLPCFPFRWRRYLKEKKFGYKNFPWKVQKFWKKKGFKVFFFSLSPALLNIRMNDYFRLFTRLRRIRVKKKVLVEYLR